MLKAVEVIGSRARNWPIKDGKDQIRLIKSSAASTDDSLENTTKQVEGVTISSRPAAKSHPTNDPHASLSLFAPRKDLEDASSSSPAVAPRASAKPPPRDYGDLFVNGETDESSGPLTERSVSPNKQNVIAPKAGGGKNYQKSRLFDVEEPESGASGSPDKRYKSHPAKYNHFDFGDGHDEPPSEAPTPIPGKPREFKKHQSQWAFEDFETPAKVSQKSRGQDSRHFDFGDDEADDTPVKKPSAPQPRRDAETHFEFQDDGVPPAGRRHGHPRGLGSSNTNSKLYETLYEEDGKPNATRKERSDTTTSTNLKDRHNTFDPHFEITDAPNSNGQASPKAATGLANIKDRRKDFDSHFVITDSSPGLGEKSASENNRPIGENRSRAVKMMDAQWEATDASPVTKNKGINIAGDGMGSRKDVSGKDKENMGIKLGGDGMGGRKGSRRVWGFGDDSGNEEPSKVAAQSKGRVKNDSFWDF